MPLTIYQASVEPMRKGVESLLKLLAKAESQAAERGLDLDDLLATRLAPDMFPLTRQIQIVSDAAKNTTARLLGETPPSWPDTETTFAELQTRLRTTHDFLGRAQASAMEGAEDRPVTMPVGPERTLTFPTGREFLFTFALPNFYFHLTAAYAILRHRGLEIGKRDYLGMV